VRNVSSYLFLLRDESLQGGQYPVGPRVYTDRRHIAPTNDSLSVDNEKGSFAEAVLGAIYAVTASHSPLGLKVGQQGEPQLAIVRKRQMAPGAVDGNAKQLRIQTVKLRQQFVVQRGLIATHRTPVSWVENENNVSAAELVQGY
jgi:hypothetical protein